MGGVFSPVIRQMSRINEEMDRLFDSLGFGSMLRMPIEAGFPALAASEAWAPDIEMVQRDNQLVIRADLPGVKKEDVTVEIDEDRVIIRGERRQERTQESRGVYRSEVSYGAFERTIPLPEGVDPEKAQANYHDGVLEISLQAPQTAQAKGRRLEIKEGPPPQSAQTTH
jgi:HSP20 family protein